MVYYSECYGGFGSHSAIGSFGYDAKLAKEWREEKEREIREREKKEREKKEENERVAKRGEDESKKELMGGGLQNYGLK